MTQSRPVRIIRKRSNLAVFIGRFSPPHLGHLEVIRQALRIAETVLIILGSANAARRFDFVPFTAQERETLLRLMLTAEENQRVVFAPVEDQGNMTKWTGLIRSTAHMLEPQDKNITLIGHAKDHTSFYLKAFRGWDSSEVDNYLGMSATPFRQDMFNGQFMDRVSTDSWRECIHPDVRDWLVDFSKTGEFDYMRRESAFVDEYQKKWGKGPHVTADLILIQGDYVLTVQRDGMPFENLMASPGGFVNPNERVVDAAFREGAEETHVKVPLNVLKRQIVGTKYYDEPHRDPRGRVYTFATTVYLNPQPPSDMLDPEAIRKFVGLPRIRRGDDARETNWTHIPTIKRAETAFDFYNMLQDSLEMLPKEDI